MERMTIGTVARCAGVGVETIRFYERKGLIEQPMRPRDRGSREYPQDAVRRIRFIREAQSIGFSLREIRELLSLRTDPGANCAEIKGRAEGKLAEVEAKIQQLRQIGVALETLIRNCPGEGPAGNCTILDALQRDAPPRTSNGGRRESK